MAVIVVGLASLWWWLRARRQESRTRSRARRDELAALLGRALPDKEDV